MKAVKIPGPGRCASGGEGLALVAPGHQLRLVRLHLHRAPPDLVFCAQSSATRCVELSIVILKLNKEANVPHLLDGLVPDDVVVCVLLGGEVHGQDGDVRGEGPDVETVDTHLAYIILLSLELQTIHRFSQSRRRPILGSSLGFTLKTLCT